MTVVRNVAVLVGSLRKGSFSGLAAQALAKLAPESLSLEIVEIRELPPYDADRDEAEAPPKTWRAFRERIKASDAVLFVTPEYNRSVPGALKNAIDVGSRPNGQSAWNAKPAAVMSVSPGAIGGFGANHHLRQSLVFLNMPTLQQPEAYVGHAGELFDANGDIITDSARKFFRNFMETFAAWIERNAG